MDSKDKTKKEVPVNGQDVLGEIFEIILEGVENEINKFLLKQKSLIEQEKEELIFDIEKDILRERLTPSELRTIQKKTLKNKEWLYDLENTYYDEIATSISYLVIYKLLLNTDKKVMESLAKEIISDYDVKEDINSVSDGIYEKFQDVIINSEDERLLAAVMQEVNKIRNQGKSCKVYVEPDYSKITPKEDDDFKFKA